MSNPVTVAQGGTALTTATDDTALIGFGGSYNAQNLPDCLDASGNHLNYSASSNAFLCGTTSSGSGSGDSVTIDGVAIDTTADFQDSPTVLFAPTDGGAGGPDVVTADTVGVNCVNCIALTTQTTGNYASGDSEAGNATSGDSATAFFGAGQIEATRGGTGDDTSATTGIARIDSGNWTYAELSGDVATSGSNATVIGSDKVLESHFKVVDSAIDEECLTYESTTGDFEWQTCGGGSDTNAVKEYFWPASATLPLDQGDSIPPITKTTGNNIDVLTCSYDDSTDECREVHFKVPSDVDPTANVTFRQIWFSLTATTNSVVWNYRCQNQGLDGVTFDTATIMIAATCDTATGAVNQRDVCTTDWAVSSLGWQTNMDISCLLCRDANVSADNMVGDAQLYATSVEIPRA